MGWRFRKTLRLSSFVRLNFSGSGVSLGLGPRGANVNIGKRGIRKTVGLPGTGISHQSFTSWTNQPAASSQQMAPAGTQSSGGRTLRNIAIVIGILMVLALIHAAKDKAVPAVTAGPTAQPVQTSAEQARPTVPPPAANRPLGADEVKEAQTLLKALGFDPGAADGIIGPNTINAVKRYEPSRGWPPSGEIDIRLLESLRASKAAPAASPVKPATSTPSMPSPASPPVTVVPNEEMRLATRVIGETAHPCGTVAAAARLPDGSVRAVCSNSEIYRVMRVGGEWLALKCSAAQRLGVHGC